MKPLPDMTSTLTRSELEAPFVIPELEPEELEHPTRVPVEWEGPFWNEVDWDRIKAKILNDGQVHTGNSVVTTDGVI